jgi:multidrug efflux pump
VAPPALAISVNYPGASAKVVEETAVALIEQELNGIENLLYMESASEQNVGTITLTFKSGTNLDLASVETQNRIKRAEPRLPEECAAPRHHRGQVGTQLPDVRFPVLAGQVTRQRGAGQLRRGQRAGKHPPHPRRGRGHPVRHRILDAPVAQARPPARLRPDTRPMWPRRCERRTCPDRHRRTGPGAGNDKGQEYAATIIAQGRLSTPEEFGNVIIRSDARGATVRVKDVARVELGAQDYNDLARVDGQPNAAIAVRMAPGANALDTAKAVNARMTELAKYFPKGIDWDRALRHLDLRRHFHHAKWSRR